MRFFPSAPWLSRLRTRLPAWAHPQWLVTGVAVAVAVAGLAVPLANAEDKDDLKDRQNQVKGQIADVKDHIHEASRRVAKIARTLDQRKSSLRTARAGLRDVRSELRTARRAAKKLATSLDAAETRLTAAKAELVEARTEVALQRDETRDTVLVQGSGTDPRIAMITSFVESGSVEEAMFNKSAYATIVGHQDQTLVGLVAAEEALEKKKGEVKAARDAVAAAKKAADDNVTVTTRLLEQAVRSEARVESLVVKTDRARRAVLRARAADRAALRRLEKRESRIKARIIALSRRQGGSYQGSTSGFLARPASGPVTSPYGYRTHPIYGYYSLHNGIDFGGGCGSSLWAGESGTVISTYYDEIYGNRLYLAIGKVNGASITLVYNHLSSYRVRNGAKVRRGAVVGSMGSTGWSTGCHLHFTVLRNGEPVNPSPYL